MLGAVALGGGEVPNRVDWGFFLFSFWLRRKAIGIYTSISRQKPRFFFLPARNSWRQGCLSFCFSRDVEDTSRFHPEARRPGPLDLIVGLVGCNWTG